MAETSTHREAVTIFATPEKRSEGAVTIRMLSGAERLFRGLCAAAIVLVLTILSIAIPLLHFVFVPIGLVLTAVVFSLGYSTKVLLVSGEGTCPGCGKPLTIQGQSFKLPFATVCNNCGRALTLRKHG